MTPALDEQRLGHIFHSRPDILAGIQDAAGLSTMPYTHTLHPSANISPHRLPLPRLPLQRNRLLRLRPPPLLLLPRPRPTATTRRQAPTSRSSQRPRLILPTTPQRRARRHSASRRRRRRGRRRPGPPRDQGHLPDGAAAQEIRPVLHPRLPVRPRRGVGRAGAGHRVRVEGHRCGFPFFSLSSLLQLHQQPTNPILLT